MKKSVKKIISSFFAVLVCGSCFAIEWGGLVNVKAVPTISIMNPLTVSVQETNDLYFWINTALNKDKSLYLNSELKYEFSWLKSGDSSVISQIFDVDLLKLSGSLNLANNAILEYSLGRYPITDSTGVVFNQTSDGLFASLTLPNIIFTGYVGYTGLLNDLDVSILDGEGVTEVSGGNLYSLAHPYLPANLSVEFPVLFGNQSLSLQANAFLDFKDSYNRYYANFVMTGPINNVSYYKLTSSLGSPNFDGFMNYTSLNFYIFPISNVSVSFGGEYASGNQVIFKPFRTFSSRVAYGSLLSPQTTGVLIPNASLTWSSGTAVYTGVTSKFIISIPENGIEKTAAEIGTDLIYNLFSDLQVGLNVDWFIPIGTKDDFQKFSATLNVGVSF